METKPENMEQYMKWLEKKHGVKIEDREATYYRSVTNKVKDDFETSDFWTRLIESLGKYDQEYQMETGYLLFVPFETELLTKPYESFLLKTYRKNVLENESWPKKPEGGWILPSNWFSRINDIIRTLLIVRYFDGVDFMIKRIENLCKQHNMECESFLEAREEGYYAAHLYTKQSFEIPKVTWNTEKVVFSIEIQITTQLQEVIRKLLHEYYEKRRRIMKKPVAKWQWDYKCDEFCANYLGHILHYVEGMIMEIREKQRKKL